LGLESTLDDDSESLLLLETLIDLVFLDDLLAAAKTCHNKSVEAQLMYITHAVQVQGQLLQNMSQQKRGSAADVHHAHCAGPGTTAAKHVTTKAWKRS
jgi:hypothetical protein